MAPVATSTKGWAGSAAEFVPNPPDGNDTVFIVPEVEVGDDSVRILFAFWQSFECLYERPGGDGSDSPTEHGFRHRFEHLRIVVDEKHDGVCNGGEALR